MGAFPGISHAPLLAICCFEALVFAKACLSLPADDPSSATSFVSSSRHASSCSRRAALPESQVNHAQPFWAIHHRHQDLKANTRGMADAEDCPFCRFCRPVTWRSPRLYRSRQGSENRWPIPKSNRRGGGGGGGGVGGAEATFPSLHLTSVCALC
ncbi:hypothetical protein F5883DRAFT_535137 [Diaporthe sp. PMI_573]|nr:hypothetical protein F5883DRAFT_535137 [Diaporthaceae sp. PMI_573]